MVIVFPEDSALAARHSDSMSATGGGREATRSPDQSRRNSAPWEEFQPSVADKEKQQASLAQDGRIVVSMTWENARVLEGELPDIELGRWRVLFQTHEMAVAAVDTLRESLGNKIAVWYNSTPLDERGWPIFENAVSSEAIHRALFYPIIKKALIANMAPKIVELGPHGPTNVAMTLSNDDPAAKRIHKTREAILGATFTGKGDAELVVDLFNGYCSDIHIALGKVAKQIGDTVKDLRYEGPGNRNGEPHGEGILHRIDGSVFTGQFVNGVREGQGKQEFPNGDIYDGEWKNGDRHGTGKMLFYNGSTLEASYVDNRRQKNGARLTYKNGNTYEGSLQGLERHTTDVQAKMTYATGDCYEGHFRNDKLNGYGIFTFKDGDQFKGRWRNNEPQGNHNQEFEISVRSQELMGTMMSALKMKLAHTVGKI